MTSCRVYVIRNADKNRRNFFIGLHTVYTGREHGCAVHTTGVHGPCWEKALYDNAFYHTGRVHGPWTRVKNVPAFTGRAHGPCRVNRP